MQIHQLRYFCAGAKAGSFTRAAEHEHLAQPSLSQQVRKLEEELGERLFDRLGRTVRLTSFGQTFLPRADAILREVDDAKQEIEEMAGLEREQDRCGSYPDHRPLFPGEPVGQLRPQIPGSPGQRGGRGHIGTAGAPPGNYDRRGIDGSANTASPFCL